MELVNCKKCGKVMVSRGSKLCGNCREIQKSQIEIITDYISRNPHSTMLEVHSKTGIPFDTIQLLIAEKIISFR